MLFKKKPSTSWVFLASQVEELTSFKSFLKHKKMESSFALTLMTSGPVT